MIKKISFLISFLLSVLFISVFSAFSEKSSNIIFPERYRNWTHTKTMLIFDKKHPLYNSFGGLHHIYVNKKALEPNKKGGKYPDDSKIAFVLYEAKESNGAYEAGKMKFVALMVKNAKNFADTGGWGFQVFKSGSKEGSVKDGKKECFECHSSQKNNDYIFSKYIE